MFLRRLRWMLWNPKFWKLFRREESFGGQKFSPECFTLAKSYTLSEAAADSLSRVPLNSSDVAPSLPFALTKYRFVAAAAAERVLFS
ncbi:hypothetical protein CEXT_313831 [Caerostris extrusa]|uniref:Uncharacterized protein n=1 Tax=Caerostris extrusa TaxID=172846 RepID=A0AAV4QDV5_CAEEX|nr:hypothetical protein CEXT_313831 [Caerostris extrusa]